MLYKSLKDEVLKKKAIRDKQADYQQELMENAQEKGNPTPQGSMMPGPGFISISVILYNLDKLYESLESSSKTFRRPSGGGHRYPDRRSYHHSVDVERIHDEIEGLKEKLKSYNR